MKVNSRIILKGLIVLFILIILILLFPPYTIDKSRLYHHYFNGFNENIENQKWVYRMKGEYRFFDFFFNSDLFTKRLDETYTLKINSLKRGITAEDSIGAIDINTKSTTIKLDTLTRFGINSYLEYYLEYGEIGDAIKNITELWKEKYPRRKIDTVLTYTITEITKSKYFIGYRKL